MHRLRGPSTTNEGDPMIIPEFQMGNQKLRLLK
jgi:hypothetical protein